MRIATCFRRLTAALFLLLCGCSTVPAPGVGWREATSADDVAAPPAPGWTEREHLLGDPGGVRESLAERGISLGLAYTGEVMANARGGREEGAAYLGSVDLTLELDTEKAGLWSGGRLFAYGLHIHRTDGFSDRFVGDLQVASNIDAPETTRLYELWFEQAIGERVSVLVGQHDLNSEFAVSETAALFLNSSFGIQPDFAANAPLSIFPVAGLAARVHVTLTDAFDARLGVYDGDPGDTDSNSSGVRWELDPDEGALIVGELGLEVGDGRYLLGAWWHTADAPLLDDERRSRSHNAGVYGIADVMLLPEAGEQGLRGFLQLGASHPDRSEVPYYVGAGLVYRGALPGRDDDELGLAIARAWVSGTLADRDTAETTLELTYRAQVTGWFAVQPNVQWILDPGADPALKDALATGVRVELVF